MASVAPQLTDSQQRLLQSLNAAHGKVETALEKALQEAELPPLAWFDVLHPISRADEGMLRPRDLGCGVRISRSGLTRLTDRMEAAGVIVRKRCDEDRRGSYIGLTDAGVEMAAAMSEVIETELAMILGDVFDEREAEQLISLLSRIGVD